MSRNAKGDMKSIALHDIHVEFDGVKALDSVDMEIRRGEIRGLIGPNGAGKTTLVNVISGYQKSSAGEVFIDGVPTSTWSSQKRARAGVVRTFQGVRAFADLSVRENVEVGALGVGKSRKEAVDRGKIVIEALGLNGFEDQIANSLPYGIQRRLGIARALATEPRYLLLDEPAAGLNEEESHTLGDALQELRDEFGCGMLLIEHDMPLIMRVCQRITVLNFGKVLVSGTPTEVRENKEVITAYLGSES